MKPFTHASLVIFLVSSLPSPGGEEIVFDDLVTSRIYLEGPRSFVVAREGAGIRHSFNAFWGPGFEVAERPPARMSYELTGAPAGMQVTAAGSLEWVPGVEDVGLVANVTLSVTAEWDDFEAYCENFSFSIQVVDYFPKFAAPQDPVIIHEGRSQRRSRASFEDLPAVQRELLRWSLIDPPVGVTIGSLGGIFWNTKVGTGTERVQTVRVRAEYDTFTETLSDEVELTYYLFGTPPEGSDRRVFRVYYRDGDEGSLMGWDLEHAGDWMIASQPYPYFPQNSHEPGSIRMWRKNDRGGWNPSFILQPHLQQTPQLYGASVALTSGADREVLAVGAPALRIDSNSDAGAVYLYERSGADLTGQSWLPKGILTAPDQPRESRLGESVDLEGETLIASADQVYGENNELESGAFYIFGRDPGGEWSFREKIINPDPTPGDDHFGYPCKLDKSWIAVGATGDDERGANSGAVYLYQKEDDGWKRRQKIHSPNAAAEDQFGSRICLSDEWLFVGSPHANDDQGSVEVFRLIGESWQWQQTLTEFLADDPQFFGAALDCLGKTLVVSSPGGFALKVEDALGGNVEADGSVFRLENDQWKLDRMSNRSAGHAVILLSEDNYVVSHPTSSYSFEGERLENVGPLSSYSWSNEIESWEAYRGARSPGVRAELTPDGDADGNGVSNLMEWVWGFDPLSHRDSLGGDRRNFHEPFLEFEKHPEPRLMLPPIQQTTGIEVRLLASRDLETWTEVTPLRWGATGRYRYCTPEGFYHWSGTLQSIVLPPIEPSEPRFYRLEMTTE